MGKGERKLTLKEKKHITREIKSGYFGDGKYVVFVRNKQVPVYVIDNLAELPGGEKIRIPREFMI